MTSSCDLNWEDTKLTTYPGSPHPLGATYDGHGINFALYSESASRVYLCLFRPSHDEQKQLVEYAKIRVKGDILTLPIADTLISRLKFPFRTHSSGLACLFT